MRNIIRYIGLTAIVIGVVILISTLLTKDKEGFNSNNKNINNPKYYTASIKVLDEDSRKFVTGGEFVLKTNDGKVIAEWEGKENIKRISKLTNGTYIIEQKSSAEGYEKSDNKTFRINGESKDITIFNKLKEEVITSNEVGVDNTLSMKSYFGYIISIMIIGSGLYLIINKKAIV